MIELNEHQTKLLKEFVQLEITNTIVARGRAIKQKVESIKNGEHNTITAIVQGSSREKYKVEIDIADDSESVDGSCTCFYYLDTFENCKHIAAVALNCISRENELDGKKAKNEEILKTLLGEKKIQPASALLPENNVKAMLGMEYTMVGLPDYWTIGAPFSISHSMRTLYSSKREYSLLTSDEGKRFDMYHNKSKQHSFVQKAVKRNQFIVGCNCKQFNATEPCYHILGMLLILRDKYDRFYFQQFEDTSVEKDELLKPYGITTTDELAKEFKFGLTYSGEITLVEKPKGLLPLFSESNGAWKNITKLLPLKKIKSTIEGPILNITSTKKEEEPYDTAILFNLNSNALQGFRIDSFKITQKGAKLTYTNNKLKSKEDLMVFDNAPVGMQNALFHIIEDSLVRLLRTETNAYNISESQPFRNLTDQQIQVINREYRNALKQLAPYLNQWKHIYYLPDQDKFSKNNVVKCKFISTPLSYKVLLEENEKTVGLRVSLLNKETGEEIKDYTSHKFLIFHKKTFYFIPEGIENIKKYMPDGKLIVPIAAKFQFINQIVLPLSSQFDIDFGDVIKTEKVIAEPEPRVYLSELNEKFVMLSPKWLYGEYEMDNDQDEVTTMETLDGIMNIERKPIEEMKLVESLRKLHPSFNSQNNGYFYLHFDEVMKKNWFLTMYQELQEMDIPIFGMNTLKRFKYNTNTAKMEFKTGSGTDWFDIRMQVSYGDQIVPLATLRKAIINKQQFVLLSDGTLGMLPDEWIKKFSSLMRMGTIKDDGLQVSKLHWTVIDQLNEQVDEEAILKEIAEKKKRLKDIDNVKKIKLPTNIKATLRDYQKSGFQWMNLLDDMGWGGCLADDMGLGKTLQTLAFLSAMQTKHKGETHLIVCPTSLIYNWQTEIDKFTPHLNYYIHYGSDRVLEEHDILNADIVITSYGILRSDIEQLVQYRFGYIILDESQAIKNHLSQTAKAAQVINSRNRLILSGTPVQNNTFDLYAQFNFINPGLLGNMEFFKTEFANKIDKDNDKDKTNELRKLIYPFMLRRTKEQVAKDLPDKTETILWCEMESKQRTIYNSFKDEYRKNILKKIEEEGFAKAGIYILSGLTKLRQICDSPAILNEEEAYPNVSIKIDELMREIEENSSNHKALVFSQFTTMLQLIGKELDKRKVAYYYLDGSTKATDRQKAVAEFQENEEVKIFLISLKAGGVGLNLTAADYVYMVDPWWNPATEQQAIDRTHRIGQKKSVFAYKLICKDSIEEKILQLQQKKKSLSADLISDENGFVKKLTKEDVTYLFS